MVTLHHKVWPEGVPQHLDLPDQSMAQNLMNSAERFPDRAAIIFQGRTLSYADLIDQVERMAGYLQKSGVGFGDRVLLYMQNSSQFIIAYYAILRADAVVVPVNPMSRHAELKHLAKDTGATVAICGAELFGFIKELTGNGDLETIITASYADMGDPDFDLALPAPLDTVSEKMCQGEGVVHWSDVMEKNDRPSPHLAGPDDLSVIPYSSGTTGQPKGCVHTHRSVMATCVGGVVWNPIDETSVSLAVLPLFHVTGMTAAMNGPIYAGGCIVIMCRWDRSQAAELIKRYRITRWRSISTMAIDLVNAPDFDRFDLGSLEAIGGGGAAMPEAIARKMKDMTGLDYIEGYGLSETMAATHINPVHAPKRQCLGVPIFDVDARILSLDDDHELGPNEIGEIVMNAPQVFQGYWRNSEATKASFIEIDGKPFFRTGDIAQYDENGYFFMVDRVKRMINVSGFKVWPAEVEALMHANPDIKEACIVGETDPRRGETVCAYVVAVRDVRGKIFEEDIIDWCKNNMAAYKCPKKVVFMDNLPKSGSGKVLWRELAENGGKKATST